MFIKIGIFDFWVDEIDRFDMFRNRSILKILRSWTATKMFFVCLVDFLKTNYTFR